MECEAGVVIYMGYAIFTGLSEAQEHFICTKHKLVPALEKKIHRLQPWLSTLHCIRNQKDYLDKSYKKLVLERPKDNEKWQHVTTGR